MNGITFTPIDTYKQHSDLIAEAVKEIIHLIETDDEFQPPIHSIQIDMDEKEIVVHAKVRGVSINYNYRYAIYIDTARGTTETDAY